MRVQKLLSELSAIELHFESSRAQAQRAYWFYGDLAIVRLLGVTTPAGFEQFVAAAGQPAADLTLPPASLPPVDFELLARLAAEHGIEVLGPPGALGDCLLS